MSVKWLIIPWLFAKQADAVNRDGELHNSIDNDTSVSSELNKDKLFIRVAYNEHC